MSVPNFSEMVKRDLADLQRLRDRVLPIKVGRAVQAGVRENFRRGNFYGSAQWLTPLRTSLGFRGAGGKYGPLLSGSNHLMMSTDYYVPKPGTVVIISDTPYSNTHNEGEEIGVTTKMRKYFWARHLEDKKRYGAEAPETEFWKRMALKKPGSHIKIPRRHFLGPDKAVDRTVNDIINNELENFIKSHNHGTTTA
jgi:phage gpG-like protein